jgi:hypothetical protein
MVKGIFMVRELPIFVLEICEVTDFQVSTVVKRDLN